MLNLNLKWFEFEFTAIFVIYKYGKGCVLAHYVNTMDMRQIKTIVSQIEDKILCVKKRVQLS